MGKFAVRIRVSRKYQREGKKGNKRLEPANEKSWKKTEYVVTEGKGFVDKPNQNNLFLEVSVTDENPETLSMMLKNITSKNEAWVHLLKSVSIGVKTRTRLRSKLQEEMELVHKDYEEIVMINDSFSKETVHTSKGQYCLDNDNSIDVHGVAV